MAEKLQSSPHNPPDEQMKNLDQSTLSHADDQLNQTKLHIRDSREKRESFKKRESAVNKKGSFSSTKMKESASSVPLPMRYNLPHPRLVDFEGPRDSVFTSHEPVPFLTPDGKTELKKPTDQ